jgi:putative Holliday junction resolvase
MSRPDDGHGAGRSATRDREPQEGGATRDRPTVTSEKNLLAGGEGRLMALDLGEAHVGVAISDPTRTIARPLVSITARPWPDFLGHLSRLIRQYEPVTILVGLAIREDGTEGREASRQRQLAERLAAQVGLPVLVHDERYTTSMARQSQRELGSRGAKARIAVHSLAAAHLLRDFLDTARG